MDSGQPDEKPSRLEIEKERVVEQPEGINGAVNATGRRSTSFV